VFVVEDDIAADTRRAVGDERTLNKILYVRPAAGVVSHNELISTWEKNAGRILHKVHLPEEEILKWIKGADCACHLNFDSRISSASHLYTCCLPAYLLIFFLNMKAPKGGGLSGHPRHHKNLHRQFCDLRCPPAAGPLLARRGHRGLGRRSRSRSHTRGSLATSRWSPAYARGRSSLSLRRTSPAGGRTSARDDPPRQPLPT
jgi:hypothetical protein